MGKTIVNWSPVHGQSATTSHTIALSSMLSLDQSYRSLLTHAQLSYATMDSIYSDSKKPGFEDGGVVALERLVKSKLLKPEDVPNYTETIYKNRLDYLSGSMREGDNSDGKKLNVILHAAQVEYDFVWIDVQAGTKDRTTVELLKNADFVLVNLPQNKYIIEKFFDDIPEELKDKPYFVLIGLYDLNANYSIRNIKRQLKSKVPIFTIPYATGFRDAVNQESVTEFFVRMLRVEKGDLLYPFIDSVRDVNIALLKKLGYARSEDWS
ncbi:MULTISPECIES: hypothetical protein [unclassified Sporosarcina]|uniref:hypothetical protein n=1 Tax=unclassified Sporosarcina TaxID=2647733 RepID=UPI001A915448|nr:MULTISPECIES: hypothetical protein [unclassified Sporosarcina]MBO0589265.1 hypothetical protein [Sporosarcina sp. E16_8]MBO0601972.1 hypothetical protein [Sporosarcina sp. E16_3]